MTTKTPPLLLVTTAMPSLLTHRDPAAPDELHPHLGRLVQPRHYSSAAAMGASGVPWAADNDCFQGLDAPRYVGMLDALQGVPGCRFVTVPDVVGDAAATAEQFDAWIAELQGRSLPAALVLQDGLEAPDLRTWLDARWHLLDAVFVGGSTDWKLGPDARELAREAKARDKWVHWGRVNTERRIDYVLSTEAVDSLDGSKWARWRKTYLDAGLEYLRDACARPLTDLLSTTTTTNQGGATMATTASKTPAKKTGARKTKTRATAAATAQKIVPDDAGADTSTLRGLLLTASTVGPEAIDRAAFAIDLPGGVLEATPTAEQRHRAAQVDEVRSGLRGKARALWIIAGDEGNRLDLKVGAERAATQAKATRSATAKERGTKPPARKSSYPEEITEAVRLAKKARGTSNGAPGAKQHVAVRNAISGVLGKKATAKSVLDYLGMTERQLKDAASGKMPTEKLRKLEGLKKVAALPQVQDPKIKPWVGGRNGASILAALVEQKTR